MSGMGLIDDDGPHLPFLARIGDRRMIRGRSQFTRSLTPLPQSLVSYRMSYFLPREYSTLRTVVSWIQVHRFRYGLPWKQMSTCQRQPPHLV